MRRSWLALCALLVVTTLGCDKIQQILNKRRGKANPTTAAKPPAPDTTKKPAAPPAPTPAPVKPAARPVQDVPYDSPDTGTIAPGMAERDVYSLWGPPMGVRKAGDFTYLHYPNGCERTCGTDDVVILQNGQVVDAIVRWPGHGYSGQSSSPPGRKPSATRPTP
ncbi:MAG TPA: hypothetical protein VMH88_10030 [Gemmatimonadales bacterium]|nr:hypothetical protein [Gemmatimonadales bacterium]